MEKGIRRSQEYITFQQNPPPNKHIQSQPQVLNKKFETFAAEKRVSLGKKKSESQSKYLKNKENILQRKRKTFFPGDKINIP